MNWAKENIRAKTVLGTFSVKAERLHGKTFRSLRQFTFSGYFFHHTAFSDALAQDTIRHEYAHYRVFVLYGQLAHGKTFSGCCQTVGAYPRSRTKLSAAL